MADKEMAPRGNDTEQSGKATGGNVVKILLRYVLPFIVTIGLCYLLFAGIDFNEMISIITTHCDFRWIPLMMLLNVFAQIFRAMRWRIQLNALGIPTPLRPLVWSIFGTYAVNLVFPRLGEVWRTGYIARRQNASFTTIFGSMVADRLADTITVGLLVLVCFVIAGAQLKSYLGQNPDMLTNLQATLTNPWLWTAIGVVIIGAWLVLSRMSDNAVVRKLKSLWNELWSGFTVILKMPGKGRWLLLTALVWLSYFFGMYLTFHSFGFTSQILDHYGISAVIVTFVISSIAMAVPSNGGIGPWQWAVIFTLSFYTSGISLPAGTTFTGMATSYANLVMVATTLLSILLGIIAFTAIALERKHSK